MTHDSLSQKSTKTIQLKYYVYTEEVSKEEGAWKIKILPFKILALIVVAGSYMHFIKNIILIVLFFML